MQWKKVSLRHGRKDFIDLIVGSCGSQITVFTVISPSGASPICHSADQLTACITDIWLDQRGTPVPWEDTDLPECCDAPELDMRKSPKVFGHERTLDYLTYHIANAMNAVFSDRGFSRYLKRLAIGKWVNGSGAIEFVADGRYERSGKPLGIIAGAPASGRWYTGSNMLHLMADPAKDGIRTQVIAVTERELIFPGGAGVLQHVYERA